MNQKKNTKIILILMIIVCIIILTGGIVLAYLTTDLFKSDKDLFFKYITQIADSENGFMDKQLLQYFEKRKTTPYTNEGDFSVKVTSSSEERQEQFKNVNNFNISFSGKVDTSHAKAKQEISLNYSDTVNFPITYQQVGDTLGIQTKYVGSKLIAVRTSRLDNLSEETSNSFEEIINGVEEIQAVTQSQFSTEEREKIQNTYLEVLKQQFNQNQFSKVKEENSNGYQLSLTGEELKNLLVQLLETLKNDSTTIDKLNEYLSLQENSTKITTNSINNTIKTIQNNSDLTQENIKIIVYSKNGKTNKLVVTTKEGTITMQKTSQENQLELEISCEMVGEDSYKISFVATFEGLNTMQNVKENYRLELQYPSQAETSEEGESSAQQEELSYQYQFNHQVNFKETVDIEEFTNENSMILTDYPQEQVFNFLHAVQERILQVNQLQMEELGLAEDENPIQYILPQYLFVTNTMHSSDVNELEVNTFNQKFEMYEGTNQKAQTVKGLLSIILTNNQSFDEDMQIKEINFNGEEYEASEPNITFIKEDIAIEKNYRIEFEKDENTGMIYRAVINER